MSVRYGYVSNTWSIFFKFFIYLEGPWVVMYIYVHIHVQMWIENRCIKQNEEQEQNSSVGFLTYQCYNH